jgi:hypothetical protein
VSSHIPGIALISEVRVRQSDFSKGFRTRAGFLLTAAANVKTKLDLSFPYGVDVNQGDYFAPADAHHENRLWVEIAPNTPLAALVPGSAISADVTSSDTQVTVNAQAKAALNAFLAYGSLTQTDEVFFRLTSVPGDPTDFSALKKARWDSDNSKFVAYNGVAFGLTATAGDAIFVTVRFEDGSYIAPGEFVRIGDEILGSSYLPANTPIRFIIQNAGNSEIKLPFNLTYLHS